jgi:hypothetical protein
MMDVPRRERKGAAFPLSETNGYALLFSCNVLTLMAPIEV